MTNRRLQVSRPRPIRVNTSPPLSPTKVEARFDSLSSVHPNGIAKTPETPIRPNSSAAQRHSFAPITPITSREDVSQSGLIRDGMLEYCPEKGDYEIVPGQILGAGRFSSVYMARGIPTKCTSQSTELLTPPVTPTSPRMRHFWSGVQPDAYAIKVATDKSKISALQGEARILSRLSQEPGFKSCIVPFHGYDRRNDSLVFTALPSTLEDVIVNELAHLDSVRRNAKLCAIFPHIARSLISSLAWIHGAGVIHADIKPANILLRPDIPVTMPLAPGQSILDIPFTPVFTDFTSSFSLKDDPTSVSAMGGGTWDFLSPELLSSPFPPPTFKSDVYALSITLLSLITGVSPFSHEHNRMRKIELIKRYDVFSIVAQDTGADLRFRAASKSLKERCAVDLQALLDLGLKKDPLGRPSAEQWGPLW